MNRAQEISFKEFIVRYTVIASVVTWLISANMKDFLDELINALIEPLFSIDIDNNGEPDLIEAKKWVTDVMGIKFPIGKIVLALFKTVIFIAIVYVVVTLIFKYTDLMKLK